MLVGAALLALAPPLLIRRAEVDITPPEPLPLGGYTERHGKVMDPGGDHLFARCLELDQGGTRIAIVSAEMLTIPESLCREVKARIPAGIHLFMQATHTHCAPDSQMLNDRMTFPIPGIATFRRRWLAWYADKIASAVTSAESARPETTLRIDETVSIVSANRARRMGGKPDPRLVTVSTPSSLLFTYFTAHPTIYDADENKTRGDWPGRLAAESGAMVLNGALGDTSPAADGANVEDKFHAFFKELASHDKSFRDAVWTASSRSNVQSPKSKFQIPNSLAWDSEPIALDPKKPHPTFAKRNGIPESLAQSLVDKFAPPSDEISAIRIGSLAIVGVPGEPTSILGNEIKAAGLRMGFRSVLVCAHVDGWMGYILDPADYDQGGYEAELSFYGREEGEKVVGAAVEALQKLRSRG